MRGNQSKWSFGKIKIREENLQGRCVRGREKGEKRKKREKFLLYIIFAFEKRGRIFKDVESNGMGGKTFRSVKTIYTL